MYRYLMLVSPRGVPIVDSLSVGGAGLLVTLCLTLRLHLILRFLLCGVEEERQVKTIEKDG